MGLTFRIRGSYPNPEIWKPSLSTLNLSSAELEQAPHPTGDCHVIMVRC